MVSNDINDKTLYFSCVLFYEPLVKYVKIKNLKNKSKEKEENNTKKKEQYDYK